MKTPRDYILSIVTNKANLQHIADYGRINGSLLIDIEKCMENYANQKLDEAADNVFNYSPDAAEMIKDIKKFI